jgi:PAS domain S-box-containing protein
LDQSGRFLYVNDMGCRSLGYSREELLSMTVHDVDPSYSRESWPDSWKKIKERRSVTVETNCRRKNGATFPAEVAVSFVGFQGREYLFVSVRDITERKKTDEDLIRRDYQLEILSRTSQHINSILDASVIMRTLIAAATELVDATAGTGGMVIDGKMIFKEYNRGGRLEPVEYNFAQNEGVYKCVSKSLKTYISNDVERDPMVSQEAKDTFGIYNLITVPIINRSGSIMGCLETHNKKDRQPFDAQDVFMLQGLAASAAVALENASMLGQRDKAEKALAWQKEYYETLLDEANVWTEVVDMDGNVLMWNKKAEEITGYKKEDLIGNAKKWALIYPEAKQSKRMMTFTKKLIAAGRAIKDLETEITTVSGQKRTMSWSSTIIRDSYGKVTNSMFVGTDVTDRKTAEKDLERLNSELLRSNKRLNQLALKDIQTGLYNHHYLS